MSAWARWLLVGAVVVAGAAGTAGRGGHGEAAASDDAATLLSRGLIAAAPESNGEVELDGESAAALVQKLAGRVPLPAGGTFDGIQWAELDGTITAAQVQEVVEYNAACQWYRALRDGRQVADARRIVADAPFWQGLRGQATGDLAAGVAADVAAGGGEVVAGVLAQCDEAHKREVAYAEAGGKEAQR